MAPIVITTTRSTLQDGKQCSHAGTPARLLTVDAPHSRCLAELAVEQRACQKPEEIRDQDDHHGAEAPANEARRHIVACGQCDKVNLLDVRQEQGRTDDETGAQAALQSDHGQDRRDCPPWRPPQDAVDE